MGDLSISRANRQDLSEIEGILLSVELPTQGVAEHHEHFLRAQMVGRLVGVVGLELYGDAALLRSLAVVLEHRGRGLGRRLVEAALERAREKGVKQVFLLTINAADFFSRLGFQPLSWERVDERVQRSTEFQGVCPKSATAMSLTLSK